MTTVKLTLSNGEIKTFRGHHAKWNGDNTVLYLFQGDSDDSLEGMLKNGVQSFSLLATPILEIIPD